MFKKLLGSALALALLALTLVPLPASAFQQTLDRISGGSAVAAVSTCGTSPSIVGSDLAGTVTVGTGTPTACTITFSATYGTAPHCVVASATQLAAFSYVTTATTIVVTQTATSSNLIKYICVAQ